MDFLHLLLATKASISAALIPIASSAALLFITSDFFPSSIANWPVAQFNEARTALMDLERQV